MSTGAGGPLRVFGVEVGFATSRVVIGVRGDVDLVTAPELGAVLDAVIDRGHARVSLDLAEATFMSAAGLRVIAAGAARLGRAGGGLALESPSSLVVRLLDITGLSAVVSLEGAGARIGRLGPEQTMADPGTAVSVDAAGLVRHAHHMSAVRGVDAVVDAVLRLVVTLAKVTVGGADGVSVALTRHGRLVTVAASDQTISAMDDDQYVTGEGPCVDASTTGRWFHVERAVEETRWPSFVPKAVALGINAILSTPLMAGERPVGALNIYSRTAVAFAAAEQELASIFATQASVILRDASVAGSDGDQAARFAQALAARQMLAHAEGIVMAREHVTTAEAHRILRGFSLDTSRPLGDVAAAVVASTQPSARGAVPKAPDG